MEKGKEKIMALRTKITDKQMNNLLAGTSDLFDYAKLLERRLENSFTPASQETKFYCTYELELALDCLKSIDKETRRLTKLLSTRLK